MELSKKTDKRRRCRKVLGGFLRKCDKDSDDCGIRDVRDMDMEEKGLCEEAKGRVGTGHWQSGPGSGQGGHCARHLNQTMHND